ncbi:type I polyketide synthase [Streptomyces asiaticus]|uniref:type I polyketide synthase n=1 Tax=Streptomyces asiaticus TaxID=114695 RepID=UPI0037F1669F
MASNEEKLLDYLKRVTADLRQTQRRLKDVESAGHEPVAIVGMSCRFPGGVGSPEELWELVATERDAISELPTDRNWDLENLFHPDPDHPGTSYTREGGFIDDPAGFDAAFFGISPREALGMAPQQRLALEASWEAIEHAGVDPESLRGSRTGTFIGCDHLDYCSDASQVPEGSAGYFTIGNSASVVSGRVAYTLGLEGAAVTVDTACSSSLVAMHLACQAIRQGECDMALAGGVAVMSSTAPFIGFSELRGLAPDGRSKAFSANSDGMTLAEGVGVLLLERLSDARRNGHEVLAVIRGTAVNQDGSSNGLTAPNGPSQQRVIRQALANARLSASEVDAVEAHGTGTSLGDPIEAQALLATYGQERPEGHPLWLGSIKSNIGHAQMAAGAAGVIKMVMAMRHEVLPASLHIDEPTPHVDWSAGDVHLLTEAREWPRGEHPRRAGVSSFGISGTNAHLILEQAPEGVAEAGPVESLKPVGGPVPWVVSARGAEALRGQARALAERVNADPGVSAAEVGWSLLRSRTLFDHRAVVIGQDREELVAGLEALAAGEPHPGLVHPGGAAEVVGQTVFLFSGQGSQRPGMGAELYDRFPVFAEAFDEVCGLLDPHLEHPLRELVFSRDPEQAALLDHTTYAQAGLFALHISLARLLDSVGVRPDAVIGHSIGEIAAAHIAGVFDLPDACRLVAARATLMGGLPEGGGMVTIAATPDELTHDLTTHNGQVSIAALNTPGNTVISGPVDLIAEISATWAAKGRKTRTLTVSHAFHSPLMDPILAPFKEAISGLTYHQPTIPLISNLTGEPADEQIATPEYWAQHIRQPVHFHPAITHTTPHTGAYLELGPDPVLATATHHTLHHHTTETDRPTPLIASVLTRKQPDAQALTHTLARLHTAGVNVDWTSWFPADPAPQVVGLPTYAFQHQRFWLAPPAARTSFEGAAGDPAEAQLWHAIEELDVDALTSTLQLDKDSPGIDALLPALPVLSAWRRQHRERSTVDSWRYRATWQQLPDPAAPALTGTWLVVVPAGQEEHTTVQVTLQALRAHGATALPYAVDAHHIDRATFRERLDQLTEESQPAGVISLLALDTEPLAGHSAVSAGLGATTALIQALDDAGIDAGISAPLWCVTQGAVATGRSDLLPHPEQSPIWGFGRVAALEHPQRWGGLIDLPATMTHHTAGRLAALLAPGQPEDQVAIRTTGTYARRLTRVPAADTAPAPAPWEPTGTTLITGGTGGLGAQVARWLADRGAPRLHLVSRSGPDAPGAAELSEELTALGADVTITACDVSDRAALRRLIDAVPAEHPLTAVIHTAGTMELGQIGELDPGRLQAVLRSKALAAAHLHDLTQDLDLTAFVLFSSNAATWGSGQQAAYAAANTYLDALAEHRRARGLPATSLAWGPWGEAGMAADQHTLSHLERRGLSPLPTDLAIASLQHALTHDDTAVTIADVDWERFGRTFTAQRPSPFLTRLMPSSAEPATSTALAADDNPLRQQLSAAPAAQRHQLLVRHVQTLSATILGHSGLDAVPPGQPFQELGFDSLTAVELRNQLAATTGLALAPALVFDHPTPNALATYLGAELTGQKAAVTTRTSSAAADDEPIAIVGMACRYPGGVRSPEELWELVVAGRDAIGEMPADRDWDLDTLFDPDPERLGTSYAREGGFLHDAAGFDAAFFGISPREALAMDPQQRLLLETAWETFESAGLDRDTLAGSTTGVFAGGTYQGYGASGNSSAREVEGYLLAGGTPSVMSGRVAYAFGLEGPAVTVDTACSSSLVAMHLAAQALRQGECTMALAGGVTVMATPTTFIEFSRQRGLAADGRCKPFASAADGTGWGEGAGLLLLERLSDARRNGHRVLAVIRGSAVNQDGTSNGLTAPHGPSQQRVIGQALANARLSPAEVDVVEGHGTGTTLGDPIEAQALLATYGQERPEGRPLWLGSIKSNIGHTQAAAGVAGVIKMVMAMRHGVLPASLHIDEPTPHVDWSAGEVHLLTEAREWPRAERPRRAGVSSFGISGTNAHVIVEQAPEAAEAVEAYAVEPMGGPVPWVVSARGTEALRGQARALAERVNADPGVSAAEVGWSLLRSRTLFDHRAVVIGQDREELVTGLEALAAGEPHPGLVHPGGAAEVVGQTVFLFSGQGSQRPGMGAELYDRFPVFAEAFDEVCGLLDPHLEHPLRQVVFDSDPERTGLLDHTTYAQAGLFALHIALARLLDSVGVRPDAVIGHSIGEIAAAHIAGVFDLPDACRLVAARATLMGGLPEGGGMATIAATPDELTHDLTTHNGQVSIAALNTPGNTVISGPVDLITDISTTWAAKGRKTRTLTVSHAFHSPLMDPILEPFKEAISGLTYHQPTIPLISNLTGQPADEQIATPEYWAQHIRQPVHFHPAITHTTPHTSTYLELGPDPILTTATHHTLHHHTTKTDRPTPLIASVLTRKQPDTHALTHTLAQLHTHGTTIDWTSWYPATPTPRTIDLPTYAFHHQHYWLSSASPSGPEPIETAALVDREFWEAVEREDLEALAATIDSPAGQQPMLGAVLPTLSAWRRQHRERSVVNSWRYRTTWKRLPTPSTRPDLSGTWLLIIPAGQSDHPAVATAAQALTSHGATPLRYVLDTRTVDRDALADHLTRLATEGEPVGVLSLLALDEEPHPPYAAVPSGLAATTVLVQALGDAEIPAPLWCLTQGAVAAGPGDPLPSPRQAQTWGLGRAAALEHPRRWGGLIDLPTVIDHHTADRLAALLAPGGPEDQTAIRATGSYARRLRRAGTPTTAPRAWQPTGTTLITGGTGGLGAHVARWLARHGAPHLHLVSRSGPDAPGATQLAQELTDLGTTVTITACDASDRAALQQLLDTIPAEHPLTTVIHAAGTSDTELIADLGPERLQHVLGPKALAAAHLHELTQGLDLNAFVLFSSGAAAWGGSRQGAYAAANTYLDALAEHRRARGLPATSLAWGPWSDAGMAADETALAFYGRRGLSPLSPELAVASLQHALDHRDTTVTVADIDWERFPTAFTAQRPSPLLDDLVTAADNPTGRTAGTSTDTSVGTSLQQRLSAATPEQQHQLLLERIQSLAASILGHSGPDAIPPGQPFQELGFDSLTAVELRNQLATATGIDLAPALVFDHPTPNALATYLRAELTGQQMAVTVHTPATTVAQDEPIAIVGMACRYPGDAHSPKELWDLVMAHRDAIAEMPTDRNWDLNALYDPDPDRSGTSYVREGGFLYQAAEFDPAFFGISPREAIAMDPQQRLLLETAWETFESAGLDRDTLAGSDTGVFAGVTSQDYISLTGDTTSDVEGYVATGNIGSVVSGRVAYSFGLEGPAVTVDTACSSSLVAMHLASQALRQGECTMALAGGVTVMATPGAFIEFSRQRGLAPDARCKPFAAAADGMVWGEGVGLVLLERLSDARRNGHRVLAVVRGSAVNQDGTSNGLTAPNGPSQQRVIRQALANARLSPSEVDAVEAHGTGTTLGDPIEAQALLATYGQERPQDQPLWLGSIKSNIGHTQAAAGVAGVIKMVMAMRHGVLPASLHIDEPTPNVDWTAGDLRLLTESVPWPHGERPRRAGISSFGISGTNAHLILEQAPEPMEPAPVSDAAGVVPWVISAQSNVALRGQARALTGHIVGEPEVSASEVGWSLLRSRTLFDHRAVVIGQDREELVAGLEALAAGEPHPGLVHPGETAESTGQTVFLFSGQGSQRPGMGAELYDRFPVFAEAFDEVCGLLDPHLEHPLRQVVFDSDPERTGLLDHTTYAQAGLFALHIALARLLDSVGVRPDAVIGHSIGEIAAAHIAGVFDLPDACRLVAARATLMGGLPEGGGMATIAATPDELTHDLTTHNGQVSIAALNTPGNTVISGPLELVTKISATWAAKGRKTRTLTVSHAFHSPLMDPILEPFKKAISGLTYHPPTIPLISNLTGQPADDHITTPDYWTQHIRQPVHFHPAITHTTPHTAVYLELGPDPILTTATHHTLHHHTTENPTDRPTPLITSTLTHKQPDTHALTHTLAQLHTHGTTIDWTSWYPATPTPRTIDLPTYAFHHQHYWLAPPAPRADGRLNGHHPAEARLWDAIEELDVDALTSTLQLEKDGPGVDALLPALPVLSTWRRRHRERSTIDSWRYRVAWKQLPDPATAPALSGTWLLLVPSGLEEHPAVHATVQALDAHGAAHEVLSLDGVEARRDALAPLLSHLPDGSTPEGILSLLALDQTPHPDHPAVPTGLAATAAVVQALGQTPLIAPLWCVTQGAVAATATDPLPHPHQAQIWGMGRVAALEHPHLWGGLIDLPADVDARTPARIAAVLAPGQPEDQVAIRAAALARRLERAACPDTAPTAWRPAGTTLITGGTGGLGAHVARWLARQGAPRIHLVSRSGPDAPGATQLVQELTGLGTTVTVTACDVSDRAALRHLLGTIPAEHPLTAVVHAAGLAENTPLAELDLPGIAAVLRPKALAAAHLHELTEDLDLSAFVLFSSGAAAWGGSRQPSYAAANAYLDALAEHRRARGLPATSLAWAPWSDAGMAADEAVIDYYRRRGMRPLDTDLAIVSLQHALDHADTTITIADIDWERFPAGFTAQRPSPLLSDLAVTASPGPDATSDADAALSNSLQRQLTTGSPAQQHQLLLHHIQTHAAAILGHPTIDAVPPAQPFQELGFDSLTAVEFGHRLSAATGLDLPPTLVFDHPTPKELADYLRERLVEGQLTSEGHLLSELDRWDSVSEPSAVDEAARRRITGRLRLLLAKWSDTERETERSAAHSELETATAEDIFDLISDEFGKSDELGKS